MKILILDDDKLRHEQFKKKFNLESDILTHVYTAKDCINILQKEDKFDLICLDHDLGESKMVLSGKETGYEVAEWIYNNLQVDKLPIAIYLHSVNPAGRKNMVNVLNNKCRVIEFPFFWNKIGGCNCL